METPEQIQARIDLMKMQLEELEKKKAILSLPLEATLTDVLFTGIGGKIEIKFNRPPDTNVVDKLRFIPTRNYIFSREVNQFDIEQFSRVKYELGELDISIKVSEENQKKLDEWNNSPDFRISLLKERSQIKIDKTIRQKRLGYLFEISTFTEHQLHGYWTFSSNEILNWIEIANKSLTHYKIEYSDDVTKLIKETLERDKVLNEFADMKDAPDIDFHFEWVDSNGNINRYDLKPDQRVACKFDDTFNNRCLVSYDMGKGKTAIAIAQAERHNERVLFICKADLKTNIRREIRKFTGKDALVFSGIEPDGLSVDLMLVRKQQYNILNYDVIGRAIEDKDKGISLMKWVELINLSRFDRIIYDEAHYMKNMESQRSRGGRSLKACKVMLLTGTPIVNRPGELFPILNIIEPTLFPDYSQFLRQFTTDGFHPKNLSQLHATLKRYMIRRLRDKNLDPNRIPQYTELSPEARRKYSKIFEGVYEALRKPDYKKDVNNVLVELLRCKQICADDKVDFTVDLAQTALDETEPFPWNKVLIFSQFKDTQAAIASRIHGAKIINGDVTDRNRYDLVDEFMNPSSPLKVIVTNVVEGLTLTQAGTVIINDLWWTPKDHVQAEGRAFGRENDPHGGNSYYVLAEDTIDDMIWLLLEAKMKMSKAIVDDMYTSKIEIEGSLFEDLIKKIKEK